MKNLFNKIYVIQQRLGAVVKDSNNPYYNSKYFDVNSVIEALKPLINEVGLVVMQPLSEINGLPAITLIVADPVSGEFIERSYVITAVSDAQKMGASVTYWRRYGLVSFFLIQGEVDSDANELVSPPARKSPPPAAADTQTSGGGFKGARKWKGN